MREAAPPAGLAVLVMSGFRTTQLVTVATTPPAALGTYSYRSVALPDVYHLLLIVGNARARVQHRLTTRY